MNLFEGRLKVSAPPIVQPRCKECGELIKDEHMYARINGERIYYHLNHRPMFFYRSKI